ncbi:MAG: peroxidase [Acidobacteria bacterium]|nr:MAG: peroxidase [Acidobacteriota bacterium]
MPWIRTVPPDEATGLLRQIYDAAVQRAGRVYNVVRLQSLRPKVLRASTQLYLKLMHAPEGALTRAQREMIAVVVSAANGCHY